MSWLSQYLFDPIRSALARAAASANPAVAALGAAGAASYTAISSTLKAAAPAIASSAVAAVTSSAPTVTSTPAPATGANSTAAQTSPILTTLENDLNAAIDAALVAAFPGGAGTATAELANLVLPLIEQHVLNYVSDLFAHAKAQTTTTPS